jgi:hypothetical protein
MTSPDKVGYFNYGPGKLLPHSVPKGSKSGRASLKTRKGRASFKTRKGLVQGLQVILIMTSPKGPEKLQFFQRFFVADRKVSGRKNYRKGKFFQGKFF